MSFAAVQCHAKSIPERLFLAAERQSLFFLSTFQSSTTGAEGVLLLSRWHRQSAIGETRLSAPPVASLAACRRHAPKFFCVKKLALAAEGVAKALDDKDLQEDRVVPNPDRLREVSLDVATAVVLECQVATSAPRAYARTHLCSCAVTLAHI